MKHKLRLEIKFVFAVGLPEDDAEAPSRNQHRSGVQRRVRS